MHTVYRAYLGVSVNPHADDIVKPADTGRSLAVKQGMSPVTLPSLAWASVEPLIHVAECSSQASGILQSQSSQVLFHITLTILAQGCWILSFVGILSFGPHIVSSSHVRFTFKVFFRQKIVHYLRNKTCLLFFVCVFLNTSSCQTHFPDHKSESLLTTHRGSSPKKGRKTPRVCIIPKGSLHTTNTLRQI